IAERVEKPVAAVIRDFDRAIRGDRDKAGPTAAMRDIGSAARYRLAGRGGRGDEQRVGAADQIERPIVIPGERLGGRILRRPARAVVAALDVLGAVAEALLDRDRKA